MYAGTSLRKRKLLVAVFLCLLLVALPLKSIYVNTVFFFIPEQEKEELAYFFHFLNINGFPWVAKGIKPIATYYQLASIDFIPGYSVADYLSKQNELFWDLYPTNARFRAGHRVWKRYSHFFPSKKMKIISGYPSVLPAYETIMMINIEAFKEKVQENDQAFSEILGPSFDAEILLEKLVEHPGDFEKLFKGNHYLMGLVYGFGKVNARAFQLREEPYEFVLPPYLKHYSSGMENNTPLEGFLDTKIPFDPSNPWFWPPGFVVDSNHEETKKLEIEYLELFEKIASEKRGISELKWSLLQLIT